MKSAAKVREELKRAVGIMEQSESSVVPLFGEVLKRNLFREYGYASIEAYAEEELGFSASRTAQFVRLTLRLRELPRLRQAVLDGEVPWTTARAVVSVVTSSTESEWVQIARSKSRRQVEKDVRHARDAARVRRRTDPEQQPLLNAQLSAKPSLSVPQVVTLRFSPEEFAAYERLVAVQRKAGDRRTREQFMLAGVAAESSPDTSPVKSPYRVVTYVCSNCRDAHTPTSRGNLQVTARQLSAHLANADMVDSAGRETRAIPARTRRQVLTRDGHRCRSKGCRHVSFLEVHHLLPRAAGGSNDLSNLVTLCSACHRALHDSSNWQHVTRVLTPEPRAP